MRKFILSAMLVAVFVIAGCAAMDKYLSPGSDGMSAAERMGRAGAPMINTMTGGPWGELGMAGLMLLQNGYLLIRRIQKARAVRVAAAAPLPGDAQA